MKITKVAFDFRFQVLSRTSKLARCLITHVGKVKLKDMVKGIIRREYICEKHRDLAEIATSFGIGDTVLARVVGVGEGDFIMSTAEDNLGVAQSISKAGEEMWRCICFSQFTNFKTFRFFRILHGADWVDQDGVSC
jgi:hypothetical protein